MGTDIKEVVYNGTVLDKVIYNGTVVFEKIVGLPDGTIGLFYGGNNVAGNDVDRLDSNIAYVGITSYVGTARAVSAGANVGGNGLFYGGATSNDVDLNKVTIINSDGVLVGSERNTGTYRRGHAGCTVGSNGLFYGGYKRPGGNVTTYNTIIRINNLGNQVGSETSGGYARSSFAGVTAGANGLFCGGNSYSRTVTLIDSNGAIKSETQSATISTRTGLGGVSVGGKCFYYSGANSYTMTQKLAIFNNDGTMVGAETSVGIKRDSANGCNIGGNAVYYGGGGGPNIITVLAPTGALARTEIWITSKYKSNHSSVGL